MPKTLEETGIAGATITVLELVHKQTVLEHEFTMYIAEDKGTIFKDQPVITVDNQEMDGELIPHVIFISQEYYDKFKANDLIEVFINDFGAAHLIQMGYVTAN